MVSEPPFAIVLTYPTTIIALTLFSHSIVFIVEIDYFIVIIEIHCLAPFGQVYLIIVVVLYLDQFFILV